MKKLILPILLLIAAASAVYFIFFNKEETIESVDNIKVQVQEGEFVVGVTAKGELEAKRSERIRGPQKMRQMQIYRVAIMDLIAEGTLVNEGDYVARLDRSEVDSKLQNMVSEMEKSEAQLLQATLDTTIEMRGLRDQLVNLKYSMKEKELELEQSKYEPPAVIRRVELDLERLKRDYKQQETNALLKKEQAEAKVKEILSSLEQVKAKQQELLDLGAEFTIKAPKSGMLIYHRSWNGKIKSGSEISAWDPVVAQLPDLTDMISKTKVNEIDINKVKVGQKVKIKVEALEGSNYDGEVIEVANIGEQQRNSDAKVFEVIIQLNTTDSLVRPAMTTSNSITTMIYPDVTFTALEALYTDSLTYVFKEEGSSIVKQEVITGAFNENEIIVKYGLKKDDTVLLTVPENSDDLKIVRLSDEQKAAYAQELEEAKQKRAKQTSKPDESMVKETKQFN